MENNINTVPQPVASVPLPKRGFFRKFLFKRSEGKGLKITALILGIVGNIALGFMSSIFFLDFILIGALGEGTLNATESNFLNIAPLAVAVIILVGIILSALALKTPKLSGWYLTIEFILSSVIIFMALKIPVLQMAAGPSTLATLLALPVILTLLTSGIILLTNRLFVIVFDLLLVVALVVVWYINYFAYNSLSKTDQLVQSCESTGLSYDYCVYDIYLYGQATPDITYCNKINPDTPEDSYYRNSCYQSVAASSHDKSVCSSISGNQDMTDVCLKGFDKSTP